MNATLNCMRAIAGVKRRRQMAMLRGRFEATLRKAKLSFDLQDSALREFDRVANAAHSDGLPW
jgi:hypothetical protein